MEEEQSRRLGNPELTVLRATVTDLQQNTSWQPSPDSDPPHPSDLQRHSAYVAAAPHWWPVAQVTCRLQHCLYSGDSRNT